MSFNNLFFKLGTYYVSSTVLCLIHRGQYIGYNEQDRMVHFLKFNGKSNKHDDGNYWGSQEHR